MKTLALTIAASLIASTAAFADSGALDFVDYQAPSTASTFDYQPTAATGTTELGPRLGDGEPVYMAFESNGFDNQPTASIDNSVIYELGPRLGDGAPN